jgi:cytoplasmic iron level regulating protein YaaA (DUF328/UPF0246 family)
MLILLPPSEGKAAAAAGPPLDLSSLSFPELTRTRTRVLDTLIRISGQRNAHALLDVPPGLAAQVERNTRLRESPAHAAERVYTGVLYEALGLEGLPPAARARAETSILIFSGLFGVLRPSDVVPAYRLSMGVELPRAGALAGVWRKVLGPVIEEAAGGGPIVDCRSATYAAAWRAPRGIAGQVIAVRALQEVGGTRTVVSHMAKKTRGEVARALLVARTSPATVDAVLRTLRRTFEVEARQGTTWTFDVIVRG